MTADRPDRLFTSCSFDDREGAVRAKGNGHPDLYTRFTIAANGGLIEMIVTGLTWGYDEGWEAESVHTWERRSRLDPVTASAP